MGDGPVGFDCSPIGFQDVLALALKGGTRFGDWSSGML